MPIIVPDRVSSAPRRSFATFESRLLCAETLARTGRFQARKWRCNHRVTSKRFRHTDEFPKPSHGPPPATIPRPPPIACLRRRSQRETIPGENGASAPIRRFLTRNRVVGSFPTTWPSNALIRRSAASVWIDWMNYESCFGGRTARLVNKRSGAAELLCLGSFVDAITLCFKGTHPRGANSGRSRS